MVRREFGWNNFLFAFCMDYDAGFLIMQPVHIKTRHVYLVNCVCFGVSLYTDLDSVIGYIKGIRFSMVSREFCL